MKLFCFVLALFVIVSQNLIAEDYQRKAVTLYQEIANYAWVHGQSLAGFQFSHSLTSDEAYSVYILSSEKPLSQEIRQSLYSMLSQQYSDLPDLATMGSLVSESPDSEQAMANFSPLFGATYLKIYFNQYLNNSSAEYFAKNILPLMDRSLTDEEKRELIQKNLAERGYIPQGELATKWGAITKMLESLPTKPATSKSLGECSFTAIKDQAAKETKLIGSFRRGTIYSFNFPTEDTGCLINIVFQHGKNYKILIRINGQDNTFESQSLSQVQQYLQKTLQL